MLYLQDYIKFLGLKKPVDITIKTRKGRDCDAYYLPSYSDRTGKLIGHKIVIWLGEANRTFDTLLAHELIHAWQEENKKLEIHGKHFRRLAKKMETAFGLCDIYIDGVDTE